MNFTLPHRNGPPPHDTTAAGIAAAVRARRLDPVDVVEACLARVRARDHEIRAFSAVRAEAARTDAMALRDHPDLESLPLAGVPVAVKDVLDIAGMPTRLGSAAHSARPARSDAETVRRLRAAGAVLVGKTTLPELSIWGTTDGPAGITRSPVAPEHTAGGSSGGSAAAVAGGLVPLALGTDGLGSVRIPAAACGVAGWKPGEGVVPARVMGGDWHGLAVVGPLAATAGDVALAAAVLADRPSLGGADLDRPLLVAVSVRSPLPGAPVDPHWAAAAVEMAGRLRGAGHRVIEDDPRYSPLYALPLFSRWFGGVAAAADELGDDLDWPRLERRTRTHVRLGRLVHRLGGPWDGLKARWREAVTGFFHTRDVLLTPALARPPVRARAWSRAGWLSNVVSNARFAPFAAPWNLAGVPAGVVPVGTHPDGAPLAVQVVGGPGRDGIVLAVMRAVERAVAMGGPVQGRASPSSRNRSASPSSRGRAK